MIAFEIRQTQHSEPSTQHFCVQLTGSEKTFQDRSVWHMAVKKARKENSDGISFH